MRPVGLSAPLGDIHPAPALKQLAEQEQIHYPTPLVLVILPFRLSSWLHRQRLAGVPEQLL